MASLTDAVVIVTGGSTGSGRKLARAFAGHGCAVVVVYLDDQRGADAAVDEIVGANGTAIAVRADVTDELDVERLFNETVAYFGGVDVIVHADPRATRVVNQRAAVQLRNGGAIVNVGVSEVGAPFLINALRARGITILDPAPELRSPESCPDSTYCLAVLHLWQRSAEAVKGD